MCGDNNGAHWSFTTSVMTAGIPFVAFAFHLSLESVCARYIGFVIVSCSVKAGQNLSLPSVGRPIFQLPSALLCFLPLYIKPVLPRSL